MTCQSRWLIGLSILLLGSAHAQAQNPPQPGLSLTVACAGGLEGTVRFTVRNQSGGSKYLIIGSTMGWRVHLPSVELVVRRAGVADTTVRYFNPAYPGIAGRLDP